MYEMQIFIECMEFLLWRKHTPDVLMLKGIAAWIVDRVFRNVHFGCTAIFALIFPDWVFWLLTDTVVHLILTPPATHAPKPFVCCFCKRPKTPSVIMPRWCIPKRIVMVTSRKASHIHRVWCNIVCCPSSTMTLVLIHRGCHMWRRTVLALWSAIPRNVNLWTIFSVRIVRHHCWWARWNRISATLSRHRARAVSPRYCWHWTAALYRQISISLVSDREFRLWR